MMIRQICDRIMAEFPNAETYRAHFGLYGVILPWNGEVIVVTEEESGCLAVGRYTQEQWDNATADNLGFEEVASVDEAMALVNKWTGDEA